MSLSASLQHKTSNHELCMPHYIKKLKIIAHHLAKSHVSKHYCIDSKSGVNFHGVKVKLRKKKLRNETCLYYMCA